MRTLIIHRWCARAPLDSELKVIGRSRDGSLIHLARPETVQAFEEMSAAAQTQGVGLHVIWAYRSPVLQKEQFEEAEAKYGPGRGIIWLAPPGYSEHQTGWVLDIGDLSDPEADDNPLFDRTAAFQWLLGNAHRFGFELSFPPGNWQGVGYEPWHWRFVGTPEAQAVFHPRGLQALKVWGISWNKAISCWLKTWKSSKKHRGTIPVKEKL